MIRFLRIRKESIAGVSFKFGETRVGIYNKGTNFNFLVVEIDGEHVRYVDSGNRFIEDPEQEYAG